MAMSVPLNKSDKNDSCTSDLTEELLDLQRKGVIKELIVHTRRDMLEQEHKAIADQLYKEMKDESETCLDDFSPQGRRRHVEKLKARILEICIDKKLFVK